MSIMRTMRKAAKLTQAGLGQALRDRGLVTSADPRAVVDRMEQGARVPLAVVSGALDVMGVVGPARWEAVAGWCGSDAAELRRALGVA